VLTGVGVEVSKFSGVRAGVLKPGIGAESESEKFDSSHLVRVFPFPLRMRVSLIYFTKINSKCRDD